MKVYYTIGILIAACTLLTLAQSNRQSTYRVSPSKIIKMLASLGIDIKNANVVHQLSSILASNSTYAFKEFLTTLKEDISIDELLGALQVIR